MVRFCVGYLETKDNRTVGQVVEAEKYK
jgi:hypothetical protein